MSLLLCSQEYARRPLYVELLGIHLFTPQELSYVIYHYPLLVLDGFINDSLLEFLREELNMGLLAVKLERWLKRQEKLDEALLLILQESGYYSGAEIGRFKHRLMSCLPCASMPGRPSFTRSFWTVRQTAMWMTGFCAGFSTTWGPAMPRPSVLTRLTRLMRRLT